MIGAALHQTWEAVVNAVPSDPAALQTIGAGIVASLLATYVYRRIRRHKARVALHTLFGVDRKCKARTADLGRGHDLHPGELLYKDGLVGRPDAVFRRRRTIVVGEYKSASMPGRKIRKRDHYQLMLYLGMFQAQYPRANVEGRLVYVSTCHRIKYNPVLYRELLEQRAGCLHLLNQAGI